MDHFCRWVPTVSRCLLLSHSCADVILFYVSDLWTYKLTAHNTAHPTPHSRQVLTICLLFFPSFFQQDTSKAHAAPCRRCRSDRWACCTLPIHVGPLSLGEGSYRLNCADSIVTATLNIRLGLPVGLVQKHWQLRKCLQ